MAALLIMLAVMAILMTVAMPVWRQQAQREKEAELVFRGEQYARAIALYRFKNSQIPNALPPSIDVLVEGRFLRKKYKDPMTKDGEFLPIQMATQAGPGQQQDPSAPQPQQPQRGGGRSGMPQQPGGGRSGPGGSTVAIGGIQGVRSKSTENSIRSYRGATRYDQWAFTFNVAPRPGGSMAPANSGEPGADGRFPNQGGAGRGGRGGTDPRNNPTSNPRPGQFPGGQGQGPGRGGTPGTTFTPGGSFPPPMPPSAPNGSPSRPGRGGGGQQ